MADFPNPTGRFQEDTQKLIELLNAVDFTRSQLPREVLEDLQPGKRMCKLEYAVQIQLISKLEHARLRVQADLRPIDKKLMNLAVRLGTYVRGGDTVSAKMAHAALERGIVDIRCNIPQNPDIPPEMFVKTNAEYLDRWIDLVNWAEVYDKTTKGLLAQRRSHEQAVEQLEQSINKICTRIEADPEFGSAFFHILDHDTKMDRSNWTQAQREVHLMLVEHRINQVTLQMSNVQLSSLEQDQLAVRQKIDTLRLQLASVPIITDPNLLTKYKESMEKFIQDMAASDAFAAEAVRQNEEMEGALRHLEETDSYDRQRSAAAESAQRTLEQILHLNQDDSFQTQDSRLRSEHYN